MNRISKIEFWPKPKTALLFSIPNIPGALVEALSLFRERGINLLAVETLQLKSIDRHQAWFYLELLGNVDDDQVSQVLKAFADCSSKLQLLGSFPAEEIRKVVPAP